MKKVAIIQARMGSTRLPGKVLKRVLNKPLLEYQLERVANAKELDEYVVATTIKKQDDAIVEWCEYFGVSVFRGAEEDVLQRYFEAAVHYQAEVIIRLTSDCPLIDPQIIDQVIKVFMDNPNQYDYVSNVMNRTFPRGMDTEVFSFEALKKCHKEAIEKQHREHVTSYMYQRPDQFRLLNIEHAQDESEHRWTVDTWEDFQLIKKLIENLYPQQPNATMVEILEHIYKNPQWKKMNHHVKQKY